MTPTKNYINDTPDNTMSTRSFNLNQGNTSDVIFNCNICGESFDFNYLLKLHLKEHNQCKVCGKLFKLKFGLNRHIEKHHPKKSAVSKSNTSITNNLPVLNIEQGTHVYTSIRENSNLMDVVNSYESTVQLKTIKTEFHTSDPIHFGNVEHQDCTTLSNKRINISTLNESSNNNAIKIEEQCKRSSCTVTTPVALEDNQNSISNSFMTNHEQQINLTSTVQLNTIIKTEFHTSDPNYPNNVPNLFSCRFCERTFSRKSSLTNHEKSHTKSNNSFLLLNIKQEKGLENDKNSNENYVNRSNENKSPYCPICKKYFGHFGALTNHMIIHSNVKLYKCQICFKEFKKEFNFIIHNKKHEFNNEVKIVPSKNKNSVNVEINSNSTNSMNVKGHWFTCDVCKNKLSTPFELIAHRNIHPNNKPYECKICNKSYLEKYNWNRHLKNHYTKRLETSKGKQNTNNPKLIIGKPQSICNLNTFKCQYCKKEYNMISQWKRHLTMNEECRIHCKNKYIEYLCKICKMKFANNSALQEHSKIHTVKTYLCIDCGQEFKKNFILANHILKNHNVNTTTSNKVKHTKNEESQNTFPKILENNSVQCTVCLTILEDPKYLKQHMREHCF